MTNSPHVSTAPASSFYLRDFVLGLGDAVVVLDAGGRMVLVNAAARQVLGGAVERLPASLEMAFGRTGGQRVQALLSYARGVAGDGRGEAEALPLTLGDGRGLRVALHRVEGGHWLLRLHGVPRPLLTPALTLRDIDSESGSGSESAGRELIGMFWDSPFPATLQDSDFRLIAVNDAYVQFSGFRREELLGLDPLELQPEEDREMARFARRPGEAAADAGPADALIERRIIDAGGRERWFRGARRSLVDAQGRRLHLVVLHDCTAEHAAREQADRSERDLDQWFDMSPLGMVLYDDSGLLVRTNPAFEALAGALRETLADAPGAVQTLLAWESSAPSVLLAPGAPPLAREAWVQRPDGSQRRLRALVRGYETPGGHRRYMAAVEDLSAEEERDLARMQIGAVMDTAGVGVASFDDAGWLAGTRAAAPAPATPAALGGLGPLQSIGRDLVLPESMPDYDRLQQALRQGQRVETRYAIRHPELGLRWLLTRVEPGQLASGKRTTSVVTLDVTDQEQARSRNEQLLRELGTILESSPAGIVYLRGDVLVRCNRRFERMVGLNAGSAAGRSLRELFVGMPVAQRMVVDFLAAIEQGTVYETEFQLPRSDGVEQWISLSAESFRTSGGTVDAIAVLSDITRLKAAQNELETLARDRELMFSLSEVAIVYLRNGRLQRANEAMQHLSGYDAATLAGLEISTLFIDRQQFHQLWAIEDASLRQHGRWSGERQLRRADGSLLWVQVSKRLVVEGDPAGGIIASYANVDDRHRAEASLAQQAETTRAVLDSVLVGIVTVGRGGIEWMNRSARRMFGGGLADFVGQPISTVATPEDDHPFRRTHYLDALNEGQAETFECRVKARDGREFWVAGNAVVTRHVVRGRQLTYALLDIESRRNAEVRTAEAQASLQRIIDMAPLAIALHDAQTLDVLQLNQAALRLTGREQSAVVGQSLEAIYPAELAARQRLDMAAALASREVSTFEYRIDVDGDARVWDARYLPLAHDDHEPDQLLLVATDVTEQRAAERARLDAAIAQREMLVKEVHHRIKNNLQGVAGLMQQIAQRRPEVAEIIAEVVGQVQAIAQVYGLQVGATGPLRVKSVVEAITQSVQRTFGRDITMSLAGPQAQRWHQWALPEAESIPIALTVNELLTNAIKHSGEGELRCIVEFGDAAVRLVISNPGRLPPGFDLARVPGGVSGLGLVRALLPRRHARLVIAQRGDRVEASIDLAQPGVTQLAPL